jgi:predicted nucleic acid-binding protein
MVFLEKEPGCETVASLFVSAVERDERLLMTTVNYGEIYYIVLRECGQTKVEQIESAIRGLPLDIVAVDIDLAREAARFKALKKLSYADCFAAALTKLRKGELVTGDTEFKAVETDIKILWIY